MAYTKVVIIGGGFGGLNCAKDLRKADAKVLLIDKMNHHVFQPLLYQVATAALSPADIAIPIRETMHAQQNASVIMANIQSIDKEHKRVIASNGELFHYDYLVVATGSRHSYFGHPEWEQFAPGLKTAADAVRIRERILTSFEIAERCDSISEAEKYLRFVIIGGGPTGVELAGAVAEIAHKTMFDNFRKIKPDQAQIYLIEGKSEVLYAFHPKLDTIAHRDLEKMGIKIITGTHVTNVEHNGVWIGDEFIESYSIIWAAGNNALPLVKTLNVESDHASRVKVNPDLSIPDHPEIFVIGDAAHCPDKNGDPLPGLASVAIQQGRYVANIIKNNIDPEARKPFRYFDKGIMATIGTSKAVCRVGKLNFSGFTAWLIWSWVHVFYLNSFRNRLGVMLKWFFLYLTGYRQVRLILKAIYGSDDSVFREGDPEFEETLKRNRERLEREEKLLGDTGRFLS
ncbi:MAG: NAD(P)/FAD-dependent oxidoreductase [Chlamydiales bacterium]|nr:NAD(P)/FAD-dependent oxidoreductase [Chlamydiia bacterium]MCP5507882.1 NAD(P)/FAD-dependent oxidoreductase [Chlamydiales bacterium]